MRCATIDTAADISTLLLEARDRVGGRTYTVEGPDDGNDCLF